MEAQIPTVHQSHRQVKTALVLEGVRQLHNELWFYMQATVLFHGADSKRDAPKHVPRAIKRTWQASEGGAVNSKTNMPSNCRVLSQALARQVRKNTVPHWMAKMTYPYAPG